MAITRQQLLRATGGASVLVLLQACGGSGGYGDDAPFSQCGANGNAIAANHGHVLAIPAADLDATTNKTYNITGTSNHTHTVTFTPTQLQDLKAGRTVRLTSSTDSNHNHEVTASCA
jgi:hypothetical protein